MKKETLALDIEVQYRGSDALSFSFNESTLRAIALELKTESEEVFVWNASNHVAVWVVGASADFVVSVFAQYQSHFIKMQLMDNTEAVKLFDNILEHNLWYNTSMTSKFEAFMQAYKLALEVQGLGPGLYPSVRESLNFFNNAPLVAASRNSWTTSSTTKNYDKVTVKAKDLFYHFGIN
jgi:hypothetical protein